jgi:2-C-methyl-D-erythritol 2,4-cyclodiphosphate synthase
MSGFRPPAKSVNILTRWRRGVQDWRIGIGYDLHAVATGRPLRLGGVTVPCDIGLQGHSDADIVLHAVIDALFGAAGLPDIGEHFPDHDPAWRGTDSRVLLRTALQEVLGEGWTVHNVDVIIVTERPRLREHKGAIRSSLAGLLSVPEGRISVKAKTCEGFDAIGNGRAMACQAAVLIRRPLTV